MKKNVMLLFLFCAALMLSAQNFDGGGSQLDGWLSAKEISAQQAAAMLLPASGVDVFSLEDAYGFAMEKKMFPKKITAIQPLTVEQFAYVAAKAFGIRASLFFMMIPVPRYAYRDLKYLNIIQYTGNPQSYITGEQALQITSSLLDWEENK